MRGWQRKGGAPGWLVVRRAVPPLPPPSEPEKVFGTAGGWWQRLSGSRCCDPRSATRGGDVPV